MRRSSVVAGGLVAAGAAVVLVAAVRVAVLWIVEPGSEYLAPTGGVLLAAGVAVLVLRRRPRPLLGAAGLLLAGLAAGGLARLVAVLASTDGGAGTIVRYGPGTPPSLSWTLAASAMLGPGLAALGAALVALGAVRAARFGAARLARRLRAS